MKTVYTKLHKEQSDIFFNVLEEGTSAATLQSIYLELYACSRATGNSDVELYSRFSQLHLTKGSTLYLEMQGKK